MDLSSADELELPIPNFDMMQKQKVQEQKLRESYYTQNELKSLRKRESLYSKIFHVGLNRLRNAQKRDRKPAVPIFKKGDEEEEPS